MHKIYFLGVFLKVDKKGYQTFNVYSEIKRRIITLRIKPGEVLEEKRLSEELGVGRTPVREALLLLKSEGLIESQPNKTAYVKEMTLKGVKDLFESLMTIEKVTASLAVQRITPEILKEIENTCREIEKAIKRGDITIIELQNRHFHRLIAKASDNDYLFSIHENLRNQAERLSYLAISKDYENAPSLREHLQKIKEQHRVMVKCLKEKNIKEMEKLSIEHIRLFQSRIMLYLNQYKI